MLYNDAIAYLENISALGSKLGLERIQELLNKLDNPQNKLKCIHVAGTNGKGSACSLLKNILIEAGYKVGVYTSPHLQEYTERFEINLTPIPKEDFAKELQLIQTICKEMEQSSIGHPTIFELLTAMAFHYFLKENVDIVILEVGLGGRFDATNVITKPLLSLIMSIGMDHMDYLGHSLEQIAMEKAGIIKENCPVVLYSQSEVVYNKIMEICSGKNANLYYAKQSNIQIIKQSLKETIFSIENKYFSYPRVHLPLLGSYQMQNCATVLLACHVLQKIGLSISTTQILNGIQKAYWNGRMEVCQQNPLVVLDGAHNTDGIIALSQSIPQYFIGKKITLLLGVLGDKEYNKMTEAILPLVDTIVLTEPFNERKLTVDELESFLSSWKKPIYKNADIKQAYQLALQQTGENDVLLCCGSLYMIGEVRNYIFNRR